MKLRVLQDERFSCHSCTNCCRNWHVELSALETERIQNLQWPAGDPLRDVSVVIRHAGKMYAAHRNDGACIFLNESNGLCRIHEQFGESAKPLGCRLFPYQITPTFKGEASVSSRYDCPTVRKNEGVPLIEQLPVLRKFASELGPADGFDEATCCHLTRDQIEAVCEFISTMMNGFEGDERRALFIAFLCDALAATNTDELDRAALGGAFALLREQVEMAMAEPIRPPNLAARVAFRTLLGMYLRRDEDVLDHRASRFGRALGLGRVIAGHGTMRALGLSHPRGKLRHAKLFQRGIEPSHPDTFALFWRMVRNRLDSFQFMGRGNNGRNMLDGLRSLTLLYPLVRAVAKCSAAGRNAVTIEVIDVDHAVAIIEHSYGRLAVLNQPAIRSIENLLIHRSTFIRLVRTV